MKAPRYRLREFSLKRMISDLPRGRFLEIGYGDGSMLATLRTLGFTVAGFESSAPAEVAARENLIGRGFADIQLFQDRDAVGIFNYIGFFEVIGYWPDPLAELRRLRANLANGGRLIFSFTNIVGAGSAEKLTGEMRCFSRAEIEDLLKKSGFKVERVWNYGFPLTAIMRPILHFYYFLLHKLNRLETGSEAVDTSGLAHRRRGFVWLVSLGLSGVTLWPFCLLQMLFKDSSLGSGFLVIAQKS